MIQNSPILIKFHAAEHFINIRTVTRQRKSPQLFNLSRSTFIDLESQGQITVSDGYSFADIHLNEDHSLLRFDFTWLHRYGDDTVKGFAQTVTLDYRELFRHITDSLRENEPNTWSMLSIDSSGSCPKLDFSAPGAQQTIRNVLAVPVLRHKLTRAVRDYFQWPHPSDEHVIRFYADGDKYSFFFQEYYGEDKGICGGLVLHRHDSLEKSYYSVHT